MTAVDHQTVEPIAGIQLSTASADRRSGINAVAPKPSTYHPTRKTSKNASRGADTITKNYLRFLDVNGYRLSEIEQVAIGKR
jgi:hypothetical protein